MCGRTYSKGVMTVDGGFSTRLCSILCRARDGFDAGLPPYGERSPSYGLPQSSDRFRIECKGCRKPFVSRGLRCCSPECEPSYREKLDIKTTMAEAWSRCARSGNVSSVEATSRSGARVRW
jgi:hypothetical protein